MTFNSGKRISSTAVLFLWYFRALEHEYRINFNTVNGKGSWIHHISGEFQIGAFAANSSDVQACYECRALCSKVIGKVGRLEAQLPCPVSLPLNQTLLEPVNPRLSECYGTLNLVSILKVSTKKIALFLKKLGVRNFCRCMHDSVTKRQYLREILLPFFNFCKMTKKNTITINLWIITLLHVSTLSCHLQGARIHYLAKLHKYFNCSCW